MGQRRLAGREGTRILSPPSRPTTRVARCAQPGQGVVATLWLSAERTLALQRAIKRLPLDQRDALALRFFGGLGVRDVAEILGKSDGAVKMLVHRAVLALRESSEREDWR